jgi:hypothetical protein
MLSRQNCVLAIRGHCSFLMLYGSVRFKFIGKCRMLGSSLQAESATVSQPPTTIRPDLAGIHPEMSSVKIRPVTVRPKSELLASVAQANTARPVEKLVAP